MDTIKKLSALLLILCMALGLTACSADSEDIAALGQILSAAAEVLDSAAQQSEPPAQAASSAAAPADSKAPAPTPEPAEEASPAEEPDEEAPALDRDGEYTSRDDVALYLHLYGELPKNFITKNEARDLGWSGGGLDDYAFGMCIGGDRFGNYEGLLPDGSYHECDIDTLHARSRGAKRLIYADDGRIYYTDDHYESFTLLYGEE